MAIIEKTGVFTYLDSDGNEVRLYPKSKNETADVVISVLSSDWALDETTGMYKHDFTVNGNHWWNVGNIKHPEEVEWDDESFKPL